MVSANKQEGVEEDERTISDGAVAERAGRRS